MPVKYSDFLTTAKLKLSQGGLSEIELRGAVHQLYYGAYHKGYEVSNKLRVTPLQDEAGSSHARLRDFYFDLLGINPKTVLAAEDKRKSKKVSYMLRSLHDKRVVADYKIDETISVCEVDLFLRQVENCLLLMIEIEINNIK